MKLLTLEEGRGHNRTKNEQMSEFAYKREAQLEALRRQIARATGLSARAGETLSCGIGAVDAALHGGLSRGALHEIAAADYRSIPAALGFLLALTIRSQKSETGNQKRMPIQSGSDFRILWPFVKTAPAFGLPYAPGLKFFGLDPARIVFVRCANARECLWAMEEGLRLGGIGIVIGARAKKMDLTSSRRLQLSAEQANTPIFLLRAYNDHAPSAAVTRWRVRPAPSAQDKFGFYKNTRFRVALEYARGGKTGEWVMEWDHDALSLRLASALGDRTAGENRAA
jgi:protein ImuA